MRKYLYSLLLGVLAIPALAQESTDSQFGPVAGEKAFGVTLDPIASFIGNMYNGTANNALGALQGESLFLNNFSIMGKYFLSDNTAVRANIGFLFSKNNNQTYVQDDEAVFLNAFSQAKVIDSDITKRRGGSFAVGLEKRIGSGRIQGIVSGSAVYGFATTKSTYKYGNAITDINQAPTIANPANYTAIGSMPNARPTKNFTAAPSHLAGLVGSFGAEYFLCQKASIGAEVNVYLVHEWTSQRYAEYEGFNVVTNQVDTYTDLISPKSRRTELATGNIGANLFMNFYF